MAKEDKTVSNEEAVNQEQPGTPVESISLRDLDQIAQIIDLATTRGAFRGQELSTIGALYDKLATFLNSVKEQQENSRKENKIRTGRILVAELRWDPYLYAWLEISRGFIVEKNWKEI